MGRKAKVERLIGGIDGVAPLAGDGGEGGGAAVEVGPILVFCRTPARFGNGENTGIEHHFSMPGILNMLGPQTALNAQDVMGFGLGNAFCHGLEGIDFLQG